MHSQFSQSIVPAVVILGLSLLSLSFGEEAYRDPKYNFDWINRVMPADDIGRQDWRHKSPRCCFSYDCITKDRGQYAVLTTLRSPAFFPLVKELHCSIMAHNPGLRFIVAGVKGELQDSMLQDVKAFAEWREVEDLTFPNHQTSQRFAKNWFRLRFFGLTEFDAIVLLAADAVVTGDITHLFKLPTDFAWAPVSGPGINYKPGTLQFIRPCQGVADHMLQLVTSKPKYQYANAYADQSFLQWYFRYSGMVLPSVYNADSVMLRKTGNVTAGGGKPVVIHFTFEKPGPPYQNLCQSANQTSIAQEPAYKHASHLSAALVPPDAETYLPGE